MSRIFISYRRQDSIAVAGRIFDRLCEHFGFDEVFMDIDAIPSGVDFMQHLGAEMEQTKVVLALIGETWLQAHGPKGRRLDDPNDFVRNELEIAFARSIPIIPVLLGSTPMPQGDELPESIAHLSRLNAAHIDVGRDFHAHCIRLIRDLELHLHQDLASKAETEVQLESPLPDTPQALPGENSLDIYCRLYKECDACIIVCPGRIRITPQPRTALIGFRNFINNLWSIEMKSSKGRPLIWTLDIGEWSFEDYEYRAKYLNVQYFMTQLKALKYFQEHNAEERWQWLCARGVIVLRDSRRHQGQGYDQVPPPNFVAHNISFEAIAASWVASPTFRVLYGRDLERVEERNFSVFFNSTSEWQSESECDVDDLRYVGYATFRSAPDPVGRGMELPPLGLRYTEGFRTVCAAAAHTLGMSFPALEKLIRGDEAVQKLRYLGYFVLSLEEFLRLY